MPGVVFGWANMWGNWAAALVAVAVPWFTRVGGMEGPGHRRLFAVCAAGMLAAAAITRWLDATEVSNPGHFGASAGSRPPAPA